LYLYKYVLKQWIQCGAFSIHEALQRRQLRPIAVEVHGCDGPVLHAGPAARDLYRVARHGLELLDHQVHPVQTLVFKVARSRLRRRRAPAVAATNADANPTAAPADVDIEVPPAGPAGSGERSAGDQEAESNASPGSWWWTGHFL
jgi:hypothetical protein